MSPAWADNDPPSNAANINVRKVSVNFIVKKSAASTPPAIRRVFTGESPLGFCFNQIK
jgi:hypothetical protein